MRPTSSLSCGLAALLAVGSARAQQVPSPSSGPRVLDVRNRVEVEVPARAGQPASRRPALRDEVLPPGTRVSTGRDASFTLRDGDVVELHVGELTDLVAAPARAPARVASIERGVVRVLVQGSPSAPGTAITIETPGGMVSMARGEYRLHVDSSDATRVVAYQGRATVTAGHRELVVPQGMATRIDEEHPAEPVFPPVAAPRAPVWTRTFPARVLSLGGATDLEARYAAPPTQRHPVHQWVQTLARDERFADVVFERTVGPRELRMRAQALPVGTYFARVASVDGERVESAPSVPQRIEIAAPRITPSAPGRRAEVVVPRGLFCRLDGDVSLEAEVPFPLRPARAHELQCSLTANMQNPARIPIPAEQAGELSHEVSLLGRWTPEAGAATLAIRLRDASGQGYPYANIQVTANPGVAIEPVREEAERGLYRVDVRWPPNTPLSLEFTVNGVTRFSERHGPAPAPAPQPSS